MSAVSRETFAAAAVVLLFAGYVPYLRDTFAGRTRPHVFTWAVWALATAVACGVQVTHGAGPGAVVTGAAAGVCLVVAVAAARGGVGDVTGWDVVFLVGSLVALGLWLVADAPALSMVLLAAVDALGFAPTVRKSWGHPHGETLSSYVVSAARFVLAVFALDRLTVVTGFYPAVWVVLNGGFAVFLAVRRRAVASAPVVVAA